MIPVRITVDDPAELLNASAFGAGALLRVEWCATETGSYVEFATTPLVSTTLSYTIYHAAGVAGTWYRSRYSTAAPVVAADYSAYSAAFQSGETGLCDLVDVKQRLGITDTSDDEWLSEQIVAVTDEIESVTGRRFRPDPASGTKTVYLDYRGDGSGHGWGYGSGTTLWLPRGVRSVTFLGYASSDQPDGTGTYTEITGYYIDPPEHERGLGWPGTRLTLGWTSGDRFYHGRRTVKVTGAFGWAAVPPTIRSIAEMMVVSAYRARSSGGTSTFTIGTEGERTYTRMLTTATIPGLMAYMDVGFVVV